MKLKKYNEAIAAYTEAAGLSVNPGTAYFNICATQHNTSNVEGALKACDKAIQIDWNKAGSYSIRGLAMYANSTIDKQDKYVVHAGTAEYLELAPNDAHAADVKEMLGR